MITAKVRFWGADKGGRYSPPYTGFHPQIEISGEYTSCSVESIDGEEVFGFDKEHRVSLRLMFPDRYPNAFEIGESVNLYEGSKQIGTGTVLGM